ncbi:hypothetical protein NDU88_006206 [Pleurodeles waltl]|uniref:Uncharacterized protein n=1 Tax=Pleurodeles waltl TaxID=8319 RepID=A0AAV7NPJ5_PLEWA|nr:hypothetical protein NDU88_006206 [Pleurodeles waltl]
MDATRAGNDRHIAAIAQQETAWHSSVRSAVSCPQVHLASASKPQNAAFRISRRFFVSFLLRLEFLDIQ